MVDGRIEGVGGAAMCDTGITIPPAVGRPAAAIDEALNPCKLLFTSPITRLLVRVQNLVPSYFRPLPYSINIKAV